ncbi:MAG: hypothetical protein BWK79_15220 [Beggiatoa sp. IS2]|nr:MAG: hypothetical protein BWK79_15220 [Beggiatoa sp. IS2]
MKKIIGIVGGVGPYAGLDLHTKICNNTVTTGIDQDHLEVYLLSRSAHIPDRTAFLLDRTLPNPAHGIFTTVAKLVYIGAQVIGIPCNTSHALPIFQPLREQITQAGFNIELLHMIEETYHFLQSQYAHISKIGLLATQGTYFSGVYAEILESEHKYHVLLPTEVQRPLVHQAIYHPEYGIKARANPVTAKAIQALTDVGNSLIAAGAEVLIMGCTEIPLALNRAHFSVPLIDPTDILARALVHRAAPDQLAQI